MQQNKEIRFGSSPTNANLFTQYSCLHMRFIPDSPQSTSKYTSIEYSIAKRFLCYAILYTAMTLTSICCGYRNTVTKPAAITVIIPHVNKQPSLVSRYSLYQEAFHIKAVSVVSQCISLIVILSTAAVTRRRAGCTLPT